MLPPASLQGPGNLSSLPCQTRCPFLFPPLPTWLCTFSCPRQQVLCNSFLRKPHCIRSVVRKCLLLPDGAGEIREELSVWKQAISQRSNGICQYFSERIAPLLQGGSCGLLDSKMQPWHCRCEGKFMIALSSSGGQLGSRGASLYACLWNHAV